MYKELIQRKIASLLESKQNLNQKNRFNKFSFFSEDKRKEIIVWLWLQKNKDKDQLKDFIIDRFNVSEQDADKLFYEAYPDGLDLNEDELLDNLDSMLTEVAGTQPEIISDSMNILTNKAPETALEQYNLPKNVQNQVKVVISTLLQKRQII